MLTQTNLKSRSVSKPTSFASENLLLGVVFAYLVLGNLPRVIALPGFDDNLPLSEVVLYLSTLLYCLVRPRALAFTLRYLFPLYAVVTVSYLYGAFLNGLELLPTLFALRLIALLFAGHVLGFALYKRFKSSSGAFDYLLVVYLFTAALALLIYALFPDSVALWTYLETFGITFKGDPHQRRLVSPYLDPNYYAAIACLPLVLSVLVYRKTGQYRYLVLCMVTVLSIVFSISRSGLATACLLLAFIGMQSLWRSFSKRKLRSSMLFFIPLLLFATVLTSPLYVDDVVRIIERTRNVADDPSALARVASFRFGWEVFAEHPVLGVGYNYLSSYTLAVGTLSSVNSSPQAILVTFGLLLSSVLLGLLTIWVLRLYSALRKVQSREKGAYLSDVFTLFLLYLLVSMAFTSQFNNLLFYQFWLVPTVALGTYLSLWFKRVARG